MNKYYTDSNDNEVSLYELQNEDMDFDEDDAEEAAYQYKFDQFIKRMFAEGCTKPYSIQEIHAIIRAQ